VDKGFETTAHKGRAWSPAGIQISKPILEGSKFNKNPGNFMESDENMF
jgi:hypothetical protein